MVVAGRHLSSSCSQECNSAVCASVHNNGRILIAYCPCHCTACTLFYQQQSSRRTNQLSTIYLLMVSTLAAPRGMTSNGISARVELFRSSAWIHPSSCRATQTIISANSIVSLPIESNRNNIKNQSCSIRVSLRAKFYFWIYLQKGRFSLLGTVALLCSLVNANDTQATIAIFHHPLSACLSVWLFVQSADKSFTEISTGTTDKFVRPSVPLWVRVYVSVFNQWDIIILQDLFKVFQFYLRE